MPNTQRYFQLRIRSADDTSDALVVTSVPGGTNPYLCKPFKGDGRSWDPITGAVETGSYNVEVIDALLGANNRLVTAQLADAGARQQLLKRKAYGENSVDGAVWTPAFAGYVNAVRLVRPLAYDFSIGETRRISTNSDISKSIVLTRDFEGTPKTFSVFDKSTCIFGGPIRGGWLWIRDMGGWRFKIAQVRTNPKYVQMKLVRAFDPTKPENGTFSTLSKAIVNAMCARASSYYRESPKWKAATIRGYFPGILYRVQTTTGAFVGNFTPLSEPMHPDKATPPDIFTRIGEASIWVDWTGDLPTVGTQYDVYMFPTDISADNPLHYFGHPVDLRQAIWDEKGIGYDSSVLAAVRSTIGDNLRVALRIKQSPGKVKDFETVLNGLFGMGTRSDGQGREVLFASRIKLASSPGSSIGVNDLRGFGGTVFEVDESTIINKVTIKQKRLVPRIEGDISVVDQIIEVDQAISVTNSDADSTGEGDKEVIYELPGQILTENTQQDFDLEKYTLGVGREIFDRRGRGAIGGDLICLPNITVDVGQEVLVNIPQLPNAVIGNSPVSQRGGNRIVQVVRRTETPSGPELRIEDAGTTAQPGTVPTFTIVADANDPYHFAQVELTNGKVLKAAGYKTRVEIGVGGSAPSSGTLLTNLDLATMPDSAAWLTVAEAAALTVAQAAALMSGLPGVRVPAHDAGIKVWARLRSERDGWRPSAFTAFAGAQLTVLDAVTGLAASAQDAADISNRLLTWTVGANAADYPVEVYLRLSAESSAADRLVAILPPGSTRFLLTELDVANRTATVKHREKAPFNGASSASTVAVNTTGAAATLAAPSNPVAFASRHLENGVLVPDGTYGIDVNAAVFPSGIEISVAVGAGAFEVREIVPAIGFGPTRWTSVAPNDGLTRHIKARHVIPGYTNSIFCAEVTVVPWSATARYRAVFGADGSAVLVDPVTGEVTSEASLADGVKQNVAGSQRVLTKGYQSGFTKDNVTTEGVVAFSPVYQNVPRIQLRGGKAANASFPYDDFAAVSPTGSGFTCRAKNKSKGTTTDRFAEFTAPLTTTSVGGTVGPATLGNAPAYDNNYKARFKMTVVCQTIGGNEIGGTDVVVAIEVSSDAGGSWTEYATRSFHAQRTSAGTQTLVYDGNEVPVNVPGLDATDKIRLKLKSINYSGGSLPGITQTLEGYDNSPGSEGHGVLYTTSTGEAFQSKTPDTDDYVLWEAWEEAS